MNPEDQQEARTSIVCENIQNMLHARQYRGITTYKAYGVVPDGKSKWLKAVTGAWTCTDSEKKGTVCILLSPVDKSTTKTMSELRDELNKYQHIIVVYIGSSPKALQKIFGNDIDRQLEVIRHQVFMYNLMKHDETEKSSVVTGDLIADFKLFQNVMQISTEKLTKKAVTDPMMIWIGARVGDIVVTKRLYESSQVQDIYELVTGHVEAGDDEDGGGDDEE